MQIPLTLVKTIKRWRMADVTLLFLAGHQPLAFVVGQGLHLLAPVAMLAGAEHLDDLARLLSHREGLSQLEAALHEE